MYVERAVEVRVGRHSQRLSERRRDGMAAEDVVAAVDDGLYHQRAARALLAPSLAAGIDVAYVTHVSVAVCRDGIRFPLRLVDLIAYVDRGLSYLHGLVEIHLVPSSDEIRRLAHGLAVEGSGVGLHAGEALALLLIIGAEVASHTQNAASLEGCGERVGRRVYAYRRLHEGVGAASYRGQLLRRAVFRAESVIARPGAHGGRA